jgi:hypothetical protein
MVLADLHVIEHSQRIFGHHQRAVGNQVGRDGVAVDAHEAHRQARALLAGHAGLEQADHALALFADAQQQDLGLAVFHRHLVRGHQRDAAPGEELRAEQRHGGGGTPRRVHSRPKAAMPAGG